MTSQPQQGQQPTPVQVIYPFNTKRRAFNKKEEQSLSLYSDRELQEQILRTLVSIDKGLDSLNTWMRIGFFSLGALAIAILTRIGEMRVY